jgi:hypothetical protein
VSMLAAQRLVEITAGLPAVARDIQLRLAGLRRELKQHLRDRSPWRARAALDVILMLDAPSWAVLRGLLDEVPVVIDSAGFEFIARNSQIETVHAFLDSLPSALT